MKITNIDKNAMEFDFNDDHVCFEVDGVAGFEWLRENGTCERTDSQLKFNSDFSDDEIQEIHDFIDASLEALD